MQEYITDHNGSTRDKEGKLYTYHLGKPVMLPDDVAKALGESAKPTGKKIDNTEKDVKNPLNKMVSAKDVETK